MGQWKSDDEGSGEQAALGELGGPTQVPMEALSEGALFGVIDDYILREGTDYGHQEIGLDEKRAQVIKRLKSGDAVIVFDAATESCTVMKVGS